MSIYQLGNITPQIADDAWLAPCTHVIGQVQIDALASIWFGSILRADNEKIHIGKGVNIQDGCVLHNDIQAPLIIEPYVSVGHQATVHGCHIGQGSLIGMQSVLLSHSRIGKNSLVGAGSLVTEGKVFPDGVLIFGAPARVIRPLTEQEILYIQSVADGYIQKAQLYAKGLVKK